MPSVCVNHPSEPAAYNCTNCGQPSCVDCLTLIDGKPVCRTCDGKRPRSLREWMTIVAICLGVGVPTGWVLVRRLVMFLIHLNNPASPPH